MRKKQWCGALLALVLVLTLLPTAALAEGTGTKDAPILISSVQELKEFRDKVNQGDTSLCARLTADIVLNDSTFGEDDSWSGSGTLEQWTPIGEYDNDGDEVPYTGIFDGGGHTIKGLYINSDQSDIGLFGIVKNATIQNLTVTGYVKGGSYVGGIVGRVYNQSSITIRNCVNYSNVTGDGSSVGGLVGSMYTGSSITIQNCINCGNVTGYNQVGGLVGEYNQGTIVNCANLGRVKETSTDDNAYAGGMVGYAVYSTTMTACYNIGKVEGDKFVGGLVGWSNNTQESTASNCYYLDTTANAFGGTDRSDGDTSGWKKTETEFSDGTVLYLLRNGSAESPWADTCKTVEGIGMTLPWFTHPGNDTHRSDGTWHSNETEHWKVCSDCGTQYDKADHTAKAGSNCTAGNIECATCGYLLTAQQSVHNYPDKWTHNTTTHTRKCQNPGCSAEETNDCSGGKNTCVAAAVCEVCGGSYGSINEANHSDLQHVPAVAATTTAEGNIEYWYCTGCGKYFKDAAATQEIQQADTVTAKLPGSSSSSRPSYAASVEKTEHGSVTVSPKSAKKGSTVTVTVTPDQGYTLETLTVTDASGKELPLTDQGDGKFTFTQPASKVTVRAAFMDDNTMLNFFADVKSSAYYYDAVLWAAQKGITSGISDTAFGPDQPCTRAQIVTFLWRAAGSPVVNYAMNMDDVNEGSYYAEAVRWALSLGVTGGTGADAFSPDVSCTRAQAVTFLARARNAKASGKAAFSDVPSGSYYADAVAWAAESGVTTGTSADAFSPDDVCTRAQIVTFLYRAFQ